jgi:hypothetical protein
MDKLNLFNFSTPFEMVVKIPVDAFPWLTLLAAMIILIMCLMAQKGNNNGKGESSGGKKRKWERGKDAPVDEG